MLKVARSREKEEVDLWNAGEQTGKVLPHGTTMIPTVCSDTGLFGGYLSNLPLFALITAAGLTEAISCLFYVSFPFFSLMFLSDCYTFFNV